MTELAAQNASRFQVHGVWTWDGQYILCHGSSAQGGHYIGVCNKNGLTVPEWDFPDVTHYGHVSAMAGRSAVIPDGNLSKNLLTWLYYDSDQPRVEVIAAHDTEWGTVLGQATHPIL